MLATVTDVDELKAWISELGYWGPVTIIVLMAIAIIINPIPSAPIALAGRRRLRAYLGHCLCGGWCRQRGNGSFLDCPGCLVMS